MPETLLDYLTRKNPEIIPIEEACRTQTINRGYLRPRSIGKWPGISPDTVKGMYADILARSGDRVPIHIKPNELDIRNEEALKGIIFQWNRKVMEQALEETQEHLGSENTIYMEASCHAKKMRQNYVPDWATILRKRGSDPKNQVPSIMPGDTKYGWKSQDVVLGPMPRTQHLRSTDPRWTIMQIFSYCVHLHTRYGYIITNEELVLFRIGLNKSSSAGPSDWKTLESELKKGGTIEFESILWSNDNHQTGYRALSVNLALWWIHLQAVKDNTIRAVYPPLTEDVLESSRKDSTDPTGKENLEKVTPDPTLSSGEPDAPYCLSFQVNINEEHELAELPLFQRRDDSFSLFRREGSTSNRTISEYEDNNNGASPRNSFRSQNTALSNETNISERTRGHKRKAHLEETVRSSRLRQRRKRN